MRRCGFCLLLTWAAVAGAQTIVTVAGQGPNARASVDGKAANSAPLFYVYGLMRSPSSGRLILHDQATIESIQPDGTILAIAGGFNPTDGSMADGTPGSAFTFGVLRGMAEDRAGALYVADATAGKVYRIGRDGMVTTFAGGGDRTLPANGDGGPAARAALYSPRGLAFDSKGNLYIADAVGRSIRRVTPGGIISTFYALPATPAVFDHIRPFPYIEGLAIDSHDNLYAAVYSGDQVLRFSPEGDVTVVAGIGVFGFSGDGGPAVKAQLNLPSGVAVDASGTLYIADTGNHRIRKVSPAGVITTVAGSGTRGFSGDGGLAVEAQIDSPAQVVAANDGGFYFSDFLNRRIRQVSASGIIGTVAGSGDTGTSVGQGGGNGGPAIEASFYTTAVAAFDRSGNLIVGDVLGGTLRKITPAGVITGFAGDGSFGPVNDNGPAVNARLGGAYGLTVDQQDNVYIATSDSRVRRIDPTGAITTVAGTGVGSGLERNQGDGGPATAATLNEPKGVAVDAAGNLYIADTSNARLRMVDARGIIRTVAGPGQLGSDYWNGVAIDPHGNVYVAITHTDSTGIFSIIDRVAADGSRTRVAGNGKPCDTRTVAEFPYDGQPAANVPLCVILSMTFDTAGLLYIPESFYGVILRMDSAGTIARIAGSSRATALGDGGPAMAARFGYSGYFTPSSIAIDRTGNLFVPSGSRVREVTSTLLALRLSQDRVDLQPGSSRSLAVTTNFAESFPYVVQTRTNDGGDWLAVNRASGLTGEALTVSGAAAGLAPGIYRGIVTVRLFAGTPISADVPVTLTVP